MWPSWRQKTWSFGCWLGLLTLANSNVMAFHQHLGGSTGTTMLCQGMYAKGDVAGSRDSYVHVQFPEKPANNADISIVIYDWRDEAALGVFPKNDTKRPKTYICDDEAIDFKICNETQRGQFLSTPIAGEMPMIYTESVHVRTNQSEPYDIRYNITRTGWYCVNTVSLENFDAHVFWESPFGKAPPSEYPKLIFYGVFSLTYLIMFIAWATKSYYNWSDILPVQNYIGGVMFFLTVEMAMHYGFWEDYNSRGEPCNLSFFLLLIVSLGYGVVRPSLGGAMFRCKLLTYVHFVCGALYASGTMLTTPETAGLLVIVFVLPLSITMTIFYFWISFLRDDETSYILNGLTATTQLLETRKQHVKLAMYTRLWRILIFSVILLGLFFVVNTASVTHQNDPDWVARRWHYQWFILDGWLNTEYFVVFTLIAFFWRPTSENQRYGLQELPSNEQDAEDAFALDDDEDEEGHGFRVVGGGASGRGDHIQLGQVGGGGGRQRETGLGGNLPVGEPIFDIADEEDDDDDHDTEASKQKTKGARKTVEEETAEEIEAETRSDTVVVHMDKTSP
ncbi:lung seven transmembrane receptor-domain-containing protein [Syncephalis fuscata]|nr:lung seven transmembrane receptor-domain-containing protein [Syncephalis fuscata]